MLRRVLGRNAKTENVKISDSESFDKKKREEDWDKELLKYAWREEEWRVEGEGS